MYGICHSTNCQNHGGSIQEGISYPTLQMHWNSIIFLKQLLFLWNLIFNSRHEAVLMVLLVIWWRTRKFHSVLAQLLLTNHDSWPPGTHASDLEATVWWCFLLIKKNFLQWCCSLKTSHPRLLPQSPKVCYIHLCLFFYFTYRVIITIFLNSIYMH